MIIDGQGEYELEVGKHFYFSVADYILGGSPQCT